MEIDLDGDYGEEYQNLSQKELIALLKKTKLAAKKTVGSQPNSEWSGSGSSVEGSESSGSSGSGSSDSDESVETVTNKATSPSSVEGNSAARRPGQHG
jgi:hypothetical protein